MRRRVSPEDMTDETKAWRKLKTVLVLGRGWVRRLKTLTLGEKSGSGGHDEVSTSSGTPRAYISVAREGMRKEGSQRGGEKIRPYEDGSGKEEEVPESSSSSFCQAGSEDVGNPSPPLLAASLSLAFKASA